VPGFLNKGVVGLRPYFLTNDSFLIIAYLSEIG